MLSHYIMIMEQALEQVHDLPHTVSIQADGDVHPISVDCFTSVMYT